MEPHHFHPGPFIPMLAMLVPISLFIALAVIKVARSRARQAERIKLYSVIEALSVAGKPVPPELTQSLVKEEADWSDDARRSPIRDLRRGILFVALGLGFFALGVINYLQYDGYNRHMLHGPAGFAAIPFCVGLAYLLLYALGRKRA